MKSLAFYDLEKRYHLRQRLYVWAIKEGTRLYCPTKFLLIYLNVAIPN